MGSVGDFFQDIFSPRIHVDTAPPPIEEAEAQTRDILKQQDVARRQALARLGRTGTNQLEAPGLSFFSKK